MTGTQMTKTEFTAFLATKQNIPYSLAEKLLNAVLASIEDALCKDGRQALPGLGVFQCRLRGARTGRHPGTGESIPIPPSQTIIFKTAESLKKAL